MNKSMGKLFLWASGGYLGGSLLVGFAPNQVMMLLLLTLAGVIALAVTIGWRMGLLLSLATVSCGLGFWVAFERAETWRALPETITFQSEVVVIKRETPKTFYQPITLKSLRKDSLSSHILWRAPRTVEIIPGEQMSLECVLKRPENFDPRFDYAQYLATKNIGYLCDKAIAFTVLPERTEWRSLLFMLQSKLRSEIQVRLPDPAAGLLQGLFLGGDDALPTAVVESFRRAGLSHIIAVSGYNMTLVAFAMLFLALLSGLWRKTATLLAVIGIIGFLLLIDTSAASIRAALMTWMVCLAYFLGRPASSWNGLFLAGLLMTMLNPLLVRYDVGFQLSFLATLALITASPWLELFLRKKTWLRKALALLLVTSIINVFIFPVLAYHFGTMSLLSPLSNILVLPLIPITMALGFIMLLMSWCLPPLGSFFIFPVWFFLTLIIRVGEYAGRWSWSVLEGLTPSVGFIVLWYLVLAIALWYSRKSQYRYALRMDH